MVQFRRDVHRVDPSTQIFRVEVFWNEDARRTVVPMKVRPTCRRGSEESSRRNYTSMGRRSPSRSVVTMMVRRVIGRPSQFLSKIILLLEPTKHVVTLHLAPGEFLDNMPLSIFPSNNMEMSTHKSYFKNRHHVGIEALPCHVDKVFYLNKKFYKYKFFVDPQ